MRRTSPTLEPKWLLVALFFVAGTFAGGLGIYLYLSAAKSTTIKYHLAAGEHQFTNPTLASDTSASSGSSPENKDLQMKLQGIISKAESSGSVVDAGLYYRDLEPGTWITLNADDTFSPGYILKIPIMISYYKLADANPDILDEQILFNGPNLPQRDIFFNGTQLVGGQSYSVSDLIRRMVVNSDDTAAVLLFRNIDKNVLGEIFSDLGINFTEDETTPDTISLRQYSLFFRTLYNATYISLKYSEKALSLLSDNNGRSFLGNNLPTSLSFVSRMGGRSLVDSGVPLKEVYECDIVYYPQHDYLLCAFARGKSSDAIATLFSNLGTEVYSSTAYRYSQ